MQHLNFTTAMHLQKNLPRFDFGSTGHGLIDASKGTILGWYIDDMVSRPERGANGICSMESDSQYLTIDLQDMYRILYFYGGVY